MKKQLLSTLSANAETEGCGINLAAHPLNEVSTMLAQEVSA